MSAQLGIAPDTMEIILRKPAVFPRKPAMPPASPDDWGKGGDEEQMTEDGRTQDGDEEGKEGGEAGECKTPPPCSTVRVPLIAAVFNSRVPVLATSEPTTVAAYPGDLGAFNSRCPW
eukprot:6168678-Pyramimonas_sp.AAC.1